MPVSRNTVDLDARCRASTCVRKTPLIDFRPHRLRLLLQVNPLSRIPYFERSRGLLSVFMDSEEEADLESRMQSLVNEASTVGGVP